ncbi:hypothetical protein LINPERPRIM_LOCUS42926 [Linum perenne]
MVKLCLMASHGYLPGSELLFQQEHHRVFKDCQPYLPNMVAGQEIARPISLRLKPHQSMNGIELVNHFPRMDSTNGEPVLINVTDDWSNRVLSGFGMSEQCTRHDRMMQFHKSPRNELEAGGLDLSKVSELSDLQSLQLSLDLNTFTKGIFDSVNPLVDFLGDMVRSSKITIHPDGRVLLTGSKTEIKDIIPTVAEFYRANSSTSWRKHSSLIPQFSWLNAYETELSSPKVQDVNTSNPQKVESKPSLKKKKTSKKKGSIERDLYKRNYSHACESLLSLMMNKRHSGKTAILSLKKSTPELRELLTQFSAGIAGTGIAVIFSVACKVLASGTVPSSKLLNTGLGLGLVWLSWAVNELRDTIVRVSRNPSKGLKDEEEAVVATVNRSLKDVYFRAATLLAVAVLRVA